MNCVNRSMLPLLLSCVFVAAANCAGEEQMHELTPKQQDALDQVLKLAEQKRDLAESDPEAFSAMLETKMSQLEGIFPSIIGNIPAIESQETASNLASIKILAAQADRSWDAGNYSEAGIYYKSVSAATVPGSATLVSHARERLLEMENIAKELVARADAAELSNDYSTQVEALSKVVRQFAETASGAVAVQKLAALKSRPGAAAYLELAKASTLESESRFREALNLYKEIAENPRYKETIAALQAGARIKDLANNSAVRDALAAEQKAMADRTGPQMLQSVQNLLASRMPQEAIAKLEQIIEKYPGTPYADEARKRLRELK